jgi:hypothetical protein
VDVDKIKQAVTAMDELANRQKVVLAGQKPVTLIQFSEEVWDEFKSIIEQAVNNG